MSNTPAASAQPKTPSIDVELKSARLWVLIGMAFLAILSVTLMLRAVLVITLALSGHQDKIDWIVNVIVAVLFIGSMVQHTSDKMKYAALLAKKYSISK